MGTVVNAAFLDIRMQRLNGYQLVDLPAMALGLEYLRGKIDLAIIEEPFAVPPKATHLQQEGKRWAPQTSSQSAKMAFINYGRLQSLMEAIPAPWIHVRPHLWKPKMGLTRDKEFSRSTAIHKYPETADCLKLKRHEGRAEALLLAEYAHYHIWLPAQVDLAGRARG